MALIVVVGPLEVMRVSSNGRGGGSVPALVGGVMGRRFVSAPVEGVKVVSRVPRLRGNERAISEPVSGATSMGAMVPRRLERV